MGGDAPGRPGIGAAGHDRLPGLVRGLAFWFPGYPPAPPLGFSRKSAEGQGVACADRGKGVVFRILSSRPCQERASGPTPVCASARDPFEVSSLQNQGNGNCRNTSQKVRFKIRSGRRGRRLGNNEKQTPILHFVQDDSAWAADCAAGAGLRDHRRRPGNYRTCTIRAAGERAANATKKQALYQITGTIPDFLI